MSNRTFSLTLIILGTILLTAFWYKEPMNEYIDAHRTIIKDFRTSTPLETTPATQTLTPTTPTK